LKRLPSRVCVFVNSLLTDIGALTEERARCSEFRCSRCLKLYEVEAFQGHNCRQPEEALRTLAIERQRPREKPCHSYFLNELKEQAGVVDNPVYTLNLMVHDTMGRIYAVTEPLQRSLSQIVGLAQSLAKSEKENVIGGNAKEMLRYLLDPQSKHKAELRRVSLQHFLNEILSVCESRTVKAFFGLQALEALVASLQ